MSFELPPVVKLAETLLVDIERAARGFARSFKYTFGSDLRKRAFNVAVLAQRAWRERARQAIWHSYQGHLKHANSVHLTASIHRRFPWLACATRRRKFGYRLDERTFVLRVSP